MSNLLPLGILKSLSVKLKAEEKKSRDASNYDKADRLDKIEHDLRRAIKMIRENSEAVTLEALRKI